ACWTTARAVASSWRPGGRARGGSTGARPRVRRSTPTRACRRDRMTMLFLAYAHERGLTADVGGFRKLWELAAAVARRGPRVEVLYPRLPGHRALRDVPHRDYAVVNRPLLRPLTAYGALCAAALRIRPRPDVVYFRIGLALLPAALLRPRGRGNQCRSVRVPGGRGCRARGAPSRAARSRRQRARQPPRGRGHPGAGAAAHRRSR